MSTIHHSKNASSQESDSSGQLSTVLAAIKHAAIGIARVSIDGVFLDVNPAYCDIIGYECAEIIGRKFSDFTYEEDQGDNLVLFHRSLNDERIDSYTMEKRYRKKNGQPVWTMLTASLVRDDTGSPLFFVSTVQDITDRKIMEERLKDLTVDLEARVESKSKKLIRRENELGIVMNAVPISIVYVDRDYTCRFSNRCFEQWTRTSHEAVIGSQLSSVIGPAAFSFLKSRVDRSLNGETIDFDTYIKLPSRNYHANIVVVPDDEQPEDVQGCILLMSDIAPRVAQESKLLTAKVLADAANQAKTQHLANMTHELRTPLGIILGFSELLAAEYEDESMRRYLEPIKKNCGMLLRLVNENLEISKIEAGQIQIDKQDVDLIEFVRETTVALSVKAREKNLDLIVNYLDRLPQVINTDPMRLRQILFNVVGNAIKFTDSGTVRIDITYNQSGESMLVFSVTDSGIGMNASQVENIFKPYGQADLSISRKYGGTGLGLILARRLTHALGGDLVLVRTEPMVGSTFEVQIPTAVQY